MSTTTALEVRGLTKRYGGVSALTDVDLDVAEGEIHGIIGPNGAGKSTLVDVVSGFTRATAGSVASHGRTMANRPHLVARSGVIRTFQHTSVFTGETVSSNLHIAAACAPRPHRAAQRSDQSEILEATQLADVADQPADALSYGAQRRLAIAVALTARPRVLLLDEPAAGMNPVESGEFVTLVKTIARDCTVVLIEHDMEVIRALCDRSTVLVDGHVLTSGPTAEVLDDPRVIDVYLGAPA